MNDGAGTLSPDGRFIVFTKCALMETDYGAGLKGLGSCDLFISRRIGERWTPPENLGPPLNSRNWESQPSLGSDGKTLYFVRAMQAQDGLKSMDIMKSMLGDDGNFSKPEALGKTINTQFQEESVQIHPDGRTLYVTDIRGGYVEAFDVAANGALGNGRRFVTTERQPIGVAVDQRGNVYVGTQVGLQVFPATGGQAWGPTLGMGAIADLAFGGADRRILYASVGGSVQALPVTIAGF